MLTLRIWSSMGAAPEHPPSSMVQWNHTYGSCSGVSSGIKYIVHGNSYLEIEFGTTWAWTNKPWESVPDLVHDWVGHCSHTVAEHSTIEWHIWLTLNDFSVDWSSCSSIWEGLSDSGCALCWRSDLWDVVQILNNHSIPEKTPIANERCHKPTGLGPDREVRESEKGIFPSRNIYSIFKDVFESTTKMCWLETRGLNRTGCPSSSQNWTLSSHDD